MDDNAALANLKRMQASVDHKRLLVEEIEQSLSNLDTTMNFKVNSLLKSEFDKLCKKSHSNSSREIKLFMLRSVRQGRI
ncbi:hypothetical protein [Acinetobacter sp. YH16057]|uniref:hypothetical protein n=1 Tax=Acinetobacter sp. YH16057 TaxID=2601195 RepID=UPI0015D23847|nr:hypothetical protein [Acinetobacter sp. YH16057]